MKFTYTMAEAMTVAAMVIAWIPVALGQGVVEGAPIYALSIALLAIPFLYERYGPGLKLP